ncbi:MAG TPA: tetraacyldisaccharide 4'-kinase [Abditibacteriaceae bacterium]|jgi:tetraacyldisaccharide 4'-kinase
MLALAEALYAHHLEQRRLRFSASPVRLPVPVVSVGNLSVGGTGKTPTVLLVAREFSERKIGIIARGYRGSARGVAVVSDGKTILLKARECGDEPLLHAQTLLDAIVVVGKDRVAAAQRAIELGAELLILDDAFSYWSLGRDVNLVLLDARAPFDNGHLLPRGRLREEPATLARADAIILTRSDRATEAQLAATETEVAKHSGARVFRATHAPQHLRETETGARVELEKLRGAKIGALSGLADNTAFARTLEEQGGNVVAHIARRDHHAWGEGEIEAALRLCKTNGASFAVTTAKDAVKFPTRVWPLPLYVLEIELRVENAAQFFDVIKEKLSQLDFDRTLL